MLRHIPYSSLGKASLPWLEARYHFSFADYHNPDRMGFGLLRVVNDDIVQPGKGFDMHPHRDMEIITYVREGAITHRDSLGNSGKTEAGNVQVMSAGSGVLHSEYNLETIPTRLYQIWIFPDKKGLSPRWETRVFPKEISKSGLSLLVSGRISKPGIPAIHQDVSLWGGNFRKGTSFTYSADKNRNSYVLASAGHFTINDVILLKGDAAEITKETRLHFYVAEDSEILLIDLPSA